MQELLPVLGFTLFYGVVLIARRARDRDQHHWKRDAAITLVSFVVAVVLVAGGMYFLALWTAWLRPNLLTSIILIFAFVFVSEGVDNLLHWALSTNRPKQL